jgi:hypothetical protein
MIFYNRQNIHFNSRILLRGRSNLSLQNSESLKEHLRCCRFCWTWNLCSDRCLFNRIFSANKQCFSLTTNQLTVLFNLFFSAKRIRVHVSTIHHGGARVIGWTQSPPNLILLGSCHLASDYMSMV